MHYVASFSFYYSCTFICCMLWRNNPFYCNVCLIGLLYIYLQHIERPITLIEEDQHSRRASPVDRVENMFEQMMAKMSDAPMFILCVLPEKKNSNIYGLIFFPHILFSLDPDHSCNMLSVWKRNWEEASIWLWHC